MKFETPPTKGERFKAKRRRDNLSQAECAKKMNEAHMTIVRWERPAPATPDVNVELTFGELYYIARERCSLTLKKAASMMNISHITLIKIEAGDIKEERVEEYLRDHAAKNDINL